MLEHVVQELSAVAKKSRVFVSMPWVEGLTPEFMGREGTYEVGPHFRRFRASPWDLPHERGRSLHFGPWRTLRGWLFRGHPSSWSGQVFLYKEHLDRWFSGAATLGIKFPYSMEEVGWHILRTIQAVGFGANERGYLRPVLSRGFGNLGINPAKCLAPTVYCIVSTIQLYPPEAYDRGIELSGGSRDSAPQP